MAAIVPRHDSRKKWGQEFREYFFRFDAHSNFGSIPSFSASSNSHSPTPCVRVRCAFTNFTAIDMLFAAVTFFFSNSVLSRARESPFAFNFRPAMRVAAEALPPNLDAATRYKTAFSSVIDFGRPGGLRGGLTATLIVPSATPFLSTRNSFAWRAPFLLSASSCVATPNVDSWLALAR